MREFKYLTLQRELEKGIAEGIFQEKLPSVRTLAKEKNLSIATVQKAYEAMERAGLIEARIKRGYFIRPIQSIASNDYGHSYQQVFTQQAQERQVLYSINDDNLLPMSSTAPSSVINNGSLLSKLHKRVFDKGIYQFHVADEVQGSAELRKSISQFLYRQGQTISPENICITSGRREALLVALAATGDVGGTVAVESPTSFYFQSALSRLCKNVVEVTMQPNYQDELALLDQAYVKHGFSTYLVNPSFNDPTGRVLTQNDKLALLKWAQRRQVRLIEYDRSELHFSSCKPKSLAELASSFDDVCVISIQDFFDTVSTRICLGFMLFVNCHDDLLTAKHTLTEEPNLNTQMIINELISSGGYEKNLIKLRGQLVEHYLKSQDIFAQHLAPNVVVPELQGGPCIWLKTNGQSSTEVWRKLITQGVAIAPGAMFGSNIKFEDYLRITFALPWSSELALGLRKLCQALSD